MTIDSKRQKQGDNARRKNNKIKVMNNESKLMIFLTSRLKRFHRFLQFSNVIVFKAHEATIFFRPRFCLSVSLFIPLSRTEHLKNFVRQIVRFSVQHFKAIWKCCSSSTEPLLAAIARFLTSNSTYYFVYSYWRFFAYT